MPKLKITMRHVKQAISIALALAFAAAVFYLGSTTLEYPLLGHHCMKTSKSVEVSYNLVRYGDPLSQYVDWQATPDNPRGKLGSIFKYESPLSAFALAAVYSIVDGSDFETRVDAARYFTLFSLIGAYLLIAFVVFREDIFALLCFSFLVATSFFAVSYSTKPQAETFSILYQALAIAVTTMLLGSDLRPFFKSLIIAALTGLLCTGGKMNYFIIAFPMIAVYPFLDRRLKGVFPKLKYYALFAGAGLLVFLALVFFVHFDFKSTFIYFIKGNKPIIEDSLWKTFMEGFDGFPEIWDRTKEHFGSIVFEAGAYSTLYLAGKFAYLFARKKSGAQTAFESFQQVLFLFIVGHCLNYIILRNLYIPHRYYVVPLYLLFCIAFTTVVVDFKNVFCGSHPFKQRILKYWDLVRARKPLVMFNTGKERVAHFSSFLKISVFIYALHFAAGYLAGELLSDLETSASYVQTMKYWRSEEPAYAIKQELSRLTSCLGDLAHVLYYVSIGFFVLNLAAFLILSKNDSIARVFVWINNLLIKARISLAGSFLTAFFLILGPLVIVQNGKMYFEEEEFQKDKIELADQLKKIRDDTKSGDLVLCWKWCIAFYADKRSITAAKEADIDYYVQNKLDSVLGPKRPLDFYYKRVGKYPPPATYWKLRSESEIKRTKERRIQQGVFGVPIKTDGQK